MYNNGVGQWIAFLGLLALLSQALAFGGSFDVYETCRGKDSVVLSGKDQDARADPDGYFVYSGSMFFCCAGRPYGVVSKGDVRWQMTLPQIRPGQTLDNKTHNRLS